jgi:hypothetical protein
MRAKRGVVCTATFALGLVAVSGFAQQNATLSGTIVDESRAVLPGATITVTEIESGRQTVAVTNEKGEYRILNLLPGKYGLRIELGGFGSVAVPSVDLLVGQNATMNFTMKVASVAETLTVIGDTPLVNTQSSQVSGNVDRRQMENLPLQGRNWMELALQVKGVTSNNVDQRPGVETDESFELNLDGQQVTQKDASSSFGQPRFSREAIAEFQIVTNLFDVTQGRSTGIQVQAISRSGTNTPSGSVYGYFRDDKLNAADPVAGRVLPYANQQVGGTFGGPIVKDRLHYFASYEYERQPNTLFVQPNLFPTQSFAFPVTVTQNSTLIHLDHALGNAKDRMSYRASFWNSLNPFDVPATQHPSQAGRRTRDAQNALASWSRVLGAHAVQEVRAGFNAFSWANKLAVASTEKFPTYVFSTVNTGANDNWPSEFIQHVYSARYDLTVTPGRHEWKLGGEFLGWNDTGEWFILSRGEYRFSRNPTDLERRIPASQWDNPAAWDLSGLDGFIQEYDLNFGDFTLDIPRPTVALWAGDNWRANDRLTINYGVRWDADFGATSPPGVTTQMTFTPLGGPLFKSDIRDLNDVAPRVGFVCRVSDNNGFILRGGTGLFYNVPFSNVAYSQQLFNGQRMVVSSFVNDGRAGFFADPTRGVTPADVLSGKVPLPPLAPRAIAHEYPNPYTWQSSVGFQRQIGPVTAVEADIAYWTEHNVARARDLNLFFDPATGYNLDPVPFGRPDPKFNQVQWMEGSGLADYMAASMGLKRRYRDRFQAGVTYTLMFFKHDNSTNFQISANNQFDLDAEWSRSADFQRNTLRGNVLYEMPWNVSLAAAYSYGSGNYYATSLSGRPFNKPGANRLNIGAPITVAPAAQELFDGPATIATGGVVPRNALHGLPLHKVDVRVSKVVRVGQRLRVTGIAEAFNLLNHQNFGAYDGVVNSVTFGQPRQNLGNAYTPRSAQLGFRVQF